MRKNGSLNHQLKKIQPIGKKRKGKKQLRLGEAQRFSLHCLIKAQDGDDVAIAALMALWLGLRSSEIRSRTVRDLDVTLNGTCLLWIDSGKTESAQRRLELPDELAQLLENKTKNKKPTDWIFCQKRKKRI